MSVKKVNKSTGATSKVAGLVNSEKVNTMYGAFPSDASASNKLVSDATADEKISDESQVIFEVMGKMGAKNLCNTKEVINYSSDLLKKSNTLYEFTSGGHTLSLSINDDGSINLSCDGDTGATGVLIIDFPLQLENGKKYTVNGITDGSAQTYQFYLQKPNGDGTAVGYLISGEKSWIQGDGNYNVGRLRIRTYAKSEFSATLYPMIRLASITDGTYQPYAPTNKTLNEEKVSWKDNGILGAKNFVPYPYPVSSATVNGITFTTYSDGRVVANGTATELAILDVINSELYEPFSLDEGSYILTDGLSSSDYENAYTAITLTFSDSTIEYNRADTSIGKNKFSMPSKSNIKYFYLGCCVKSGATVSNLTFRPMIRIADDADDTYRLYAKTNQALTQETTGLLDNVTFAGAKNFFNYDAWKGVSITRGTAVFEDNGVTLTATENDAHTNFTSAGGYPSGANIPVQEGVPIALTWDLPNSSPVGNVFIFPNGSETGYVSTKNYDKRLVYTPTSGVSYVTLRFGVASSGNTCHYKNIQVTLASNSDNTYAPYAKTNRELTEKIDDLNGKYILNGQRFIEVEQETGDTYAALFVKLLTAINTSIASLGTNERLEVIGLEGAFAGKNLNTYMYNNTNVVNSLSFIGSAFTDNWQSSQFYTIYMSSTLASNHFLISTLKSTPTFAYEMASTTVPNGYKFALRCHVYKRLVTT